MGTFSNNMKNVASKLLNAYGQTISFERYTTTEYNTTTGAVDPVSSTTFSGTCHLGFYRSNEIDETVIELKDIKAMVYSTSEPLVGDTATIDTVDYRVINVEKIKAQGEAIVYRLQLRV